MFFAIVSGYNDRNMLSGPTILEMTPPRQRQSPNFLHFCPWFNYDDDDDDDDDDDLNCDKFPSVSQFKWDF